MSQYLTHEKVLKNRTYYCILFSCIILKPETCPVTVRAETVLSPATIQSTQATARVHMASITEAINKHVVINWLAGWLLGSQPTPVSPSPWCRRGCLTTPGRVLAPVL